MGVHYPGNGRFPSSHCGRRCPTTLVKGFPQESDIPQDGIYIGVKWTPQCPIPPTFFIMSHHHETKPVVVSDIEEALPQTAAQATDNISLNLDSKGESDHLEKTIEHELNSPEEILQRYPLLRDRSQKDMDILNRRVKRRL